jgi:hypothetical protein
VALRLVRHNDAATGSHRMSNNTPEQKAPASKAKKPINSAMNQ